MNDNKSDHHELYSALTMIDNEEEAKNFLDDLLTVQELDALSARLHAAKMLKCGMTYIEVTQQTNISSATLARINKCLKNGTGYNKIFEKTK